LDNIAISGNELYNFFQAYANYNMGIKKEGLKRALPAQLNKSASQGMLNMYNYFHAAMLPTALAGSLTEDDLAYFLIINEKVYSVVQIIQEIVDSGNYNIIESNLSTSQTGIKNAHRDLYQPEVDPHSNIEGIRRSSMITNKIRNQKILMHLNLKI